MAWPDAGGVWLFSARVGETSPSFYQIAAGPEIARHAFEALDDIVHSPVLPR